MNHRFFEDVAGVYFDDLDTFHVLHNARYLVLFERAVGAFWMDRGLGDFAANPDEQFHMVRHNEMEYLAPVRGVGRVRVRVWVERLGSSSMTFAFRLMPLDRDEICAKGRRTIVHVDPETLRPRPWSDAIREEFAPFVAPPVDETSAESGAKSSSAAS